MAVPESRFMGYSCSEVRYPSDFIRSEKELCPGNILRTLSREHSVAGNWLSRACLTQTCFRGALTSKKRMVFFNDYYDNFSSDGCHSGSSSCCQTTGWSSYRRSRKKTTKKTPKRATKKSQKKTRMKVLVQVCWTGFRDQE